MTLATRCPDCKTLNPTTSAQLQAQNGHLTCGHCGNLFSGIDHLTPADEDSWMKDQTEASDPSPAAHAKVDANPSQKPARRLRMRWPRFMDAWPRFARRWSLIGTGLLLVQLIWWQRLALAEAIPFLSPVMTVWSEAVGADLAGTPSARLKILASSLKTSQDNRLQLEVRVRNNGRTPSRWPLLDLQLLDSKRETVSSITLRIADYAVSGTDHPARTLKPGDDAELIAWIDTSVLNSQSLELPVTGFKVTVVDTVAAPASPSH